MAESQSKAFTRLLTSVPQAVKHLGKVGAPLEMRELADGVRVLQSLSHSDEEVRGTLERNHELRILPLRQVSRESFLYEDVLAAALHHHLGTSGTSQSQLLHCCGFSSITFVYV